jgi:biuret amidohydrolase
MTDTVLLALHYQNDIIHPQGKVRVGIAEGSTRRDIVIANAKRLFAGARQHGVPIVHVRIAFRPDYEDVIQNCRIFQNMAKWGALQEGSWGAEFFEDLRPRPDELVVKHTRVNAFYGCALEEALAMHRPHTLVCAGVATSYVVEHTARHASDLGYDAVVVEDACSSGDLSLHEASLRTLAMVATVESTDHALARFSGQRA